MNKEKNKLTPGLPGGFEDKWNKKLSLKKKLIEIIENNFLKFGYTELQSSSFEINENIGSFLADDDSNPMSDVFSFDDNGRLITLRYDFSSPLARFFAQENQNLPLPYKRYQIGNVWRNEKPGNGRYREFTQADCDIIGNINPAQGNSELCELIGSTLILCGLKKDQFKIKVSNRKIVQGLIDELKITNEKQKFKIMRAIDKLEKPGFGLKGVEDLLKEKRIDSSGAVTIGANLSDAQASEIINFLKIKDLKELKSNLKNPLSQEGIKELEDLLEIVSYGDYKNLINVDLSKIRGLNYYKGFIVETDLTFKVKNAKGKEINIGSICSGGSYPDIIKRFKGVDSPGTGISIGVDRLLFVMMQLDQVEVYEQKPVLVCVMEKSFLPKYYEILKTLRDNNINSEIFLDSSKNLGKQLTFANKKSCPVAVICGENEFKEDKVTLKNLLAAKGENNQITISKDNLVNEIKKFI